MAKFDYPSGIDLQEKSTEENMQYTKSYLINMIDSLTYQMNQMENELRAEIESLRAELNELLGG